MEELKKKINEIPEIKFFKKIDADDESVDTDIEDYISGCIGVSNYLDSYFRKIFKNYEHYKNCLNKTSKEKCCRFFGYWIQSQRKSFEINPSYRISEWDKCFPIFWKKLNQKHQKSDEDCNFINKNNYSYATIKIKRYLDELHSIKGVLDYPENISSERNKCLLYNIKRDYYIKEILTEISSITNFSTLNKEKFIIDDNCSLQKFFSYFQEEKCPDEPEKEIESPQGCNIPEHQLLLKQPTCPDPQTEVKIVEVITETTPTPSRSQNYLFFTPIGSPLYMRLKNRSISRNQKKTKITEEFIKNRNDGYYLKPPSSGHYITYDPL
ncbi:VIR protein [Plasmodium vivax]|uniref:VIR protein n=1 Tax=Plasmodium vivax TaxID=5855 RepID=A0A1G4GRP6_PLAVI|nr:VIR protein [Plasmodium vivax]